MKVKDLINELKKLDSNKKIVLVDSNDYEYSLLEINEVEKNCVIWIE